MGWMCETRFPSSSGMSDDERGVSGVTKRGVFPFWSHRQQVSKLKISQLQRMFDLFNRYRNVAHRKISYGR